MAKGSLFICFACFQMSCTSSPITNTIENLMDIQKTEVIDLTGKGVIISNLENEKMTQCPSVCYKDGLAYVIYYTNPDLKLERPVPSTFCKLAIIDMSKQTDIKYVDVLKSGDMVGSFKVGPYATYDPQVIVMGDFVYCIVIAVESNNIENRGYVCRRINKQTLEREDSIVRLTFTYVYENKIITVPMCEKELSRYVDLRMGREEGESYYGRPAICQPIKKDEYYYSYMGGLVYGSNAGKGYPGTLIRSQDCIHWEEVASPTHLQEMFGISDIQEAALEISGNIAYLYFRTSQAPILSYDLDSDLWDVPFNTFNGNYQRARNFLFIRDNIIYAFANCYPELETSCKGHIMRSRLRAFKYDFSLNLLGSVDLISEYGLVYPVVFSANSKVYLVCAENRRWDYVQTTGDSSDPNYPCSNIVLVHLDFLETAEF